MLRRRTPYCHPSLAVYPVIRTSRKPLAPGNSSGLWAFVNSSFGLWLLSAVLVTGLGSAYKLYEEAREKERIRITQVERLDLEIAYRLSQTMYKMERIAIQMHELDGVENRINVAIKRSNALVFSGRNVEIESAKNEFETLQAKRATLASRINATTHPVFNLSLPTSSELLGLFPEYKEIGIRGLIAENRRHVQDSARQIVDAALVASTHEFFDAGLNESLRQSSTLCAQARMLMGKVISLRWKDSPFGNLSCTSEAPFCRSYTSADGARAKVAIAGTACDRP